MVNPSAIDRYASRRSVVYGSKGVVATSQPLATTAGLKAFQAGGNAFDAVVHAAATLCTVEPFMTGIGGDVFAMFVASGDDSVRGMRSMGAAPEKATIDELSVRIDTAAESIPETGPYAVTPPGTIPGWEFLVQEYGSLSLENAVVPAVRYAREGFPVTEVIASRWQDAAETLQNEHARSEYLVNGRAPSPGSTIRLPALADSLELVAEQGSDALYYGSLGQKIVQTVQEHDGILSMEDIEQVQPELVEPVTTTYGDLEIHELPGPNQGPIAIEAFNLASEIDAGKYPLDSAEGTHRYIEAFKRAFHDGHQYISDPEFEPQAPLISKSWAQERANSINDRASQVTAAPWQPPGEDSDTVLVTAADTMGNVVTLINSIYGAFGSGLAADETGIVLQNRGSSFSLNPDHPNSVAPGKKPFHTLIPAVGEYGDNDYMGFGVMGGFMQPQGHLQVIAAIEDQGETLQQALDRPRWRYRSDGTIAVEPRFNQAVLADLLRRGHDIEINSPGRFGGGQIVRYNRGVLSGASDPRKDGMAGSV